MKTSILHYLTFAILCCLISACSNSDDETLKKITLDKEQSTDVTVAANTYSSQIVFTANAAWSARVSATSRTDGDINWIHLTDTNGSAGEIYLNFTLDYNNTGSSRTAYIIIICEDTRVIITVTQTTEDDPDGTPDQNITGIIDIEVENYREMSGMGMVFDGMQSYHFVSECGIPVRMDSQWRDDIVGKDDYCMNIDEFIFNWNDITLINPTEVKVHGRLSGTYYPSERTETFETSEHFAKVDNGRVVEGWYKWSDEFRPTNWVANYDANGYLIKTKNDDGGNVWREYSFSWENNNLKKIIEKEAGVEKSKITITYADPELKNLHRQFDLNWVLPTELECYDFAAGDITRIFASAGLLGCSSDLLITGISEFNAETNETRSYRMEYTENLPWKTEVTVTEFFNNAQTGYKKWSINYQNIK